MLDLRDFQYQRKYSDGYITHLIVNEGYIPVASGAELNALRNTTYQKMGAGTIWEGDYTTGIDKKYIQVRNITLEDYQTGTGWVPIPTSDANFLIDGNMLITKKCKITNYGVSYQGLFGGVGSGNYNQGQYKNMILDDFDISGGEHTSALVATGRVALIENCHLINSKILGSSDNNGGLIGKQRSGGTFRYNTIQYCEITGGRLIGGVVGVILLDVNGTVDIYNNYSFNNKYYSTNNAIAIIGGITGYSYAGSGKNINHINNFSLSDNINGYRYVGGLIGRTFNSQNTIVNNFSNSKVIGRGVSDIGGLVGVNAGTITNSYYDSETSGQSDTGKGEPRTTLQMVNGTANSFILPNGDIDPDSLSANAMYTGWDTDIWRFHNNKYPKIKRI